MSQLEVNGAHPGFELHKIMIPRSVDTRRLVNILDLSREIKAEVDPEMLDSLIDLLFNSFDTDNIGVDLPSRIYLLTDGKEVIASVFLTTNKERLPEKYRAVLNGYYIYNVCTATPYRGLGLMKNLLYQILLEDPDFPDLVDIGKSICYPEPVFYLTVAPDNLAAQNLYHRLGFKKIDKTEGEREYDVFEWIRS